jgi:hypothetical protein
VRRDRDLIAALRNAGADDPAARERSWRVVQAAYAGPAPRPRRRRGAPVLVAGALAAVAALGATAAAAPHSGVGHWVRSVLGDAPALRHSQPALGHVPGGGRLLVQAGASTWVVAADGHRRRLGSFTGASWSPHGLFVIAWHGRQLTALAPDGDVHWTLSRPRPVSLARWAPVDGFRIAYLSGDELRVVNGDGTGDHFYAATRAGVPPAWRPGASHVLAFAERGGRVEIAAVDRATTLGRSTPLGEPRQLRWSPDGRELLAVTRRRLVLLDAAGRQLATRAIPAGSVVGDAEWAPHGSLIAVVRFAARAGRSDVVLLDAGRSLRQRTLFSSPGRLDGSSWSPSGTRLLVGWADADAWLFLRPRVNGGLHTVAAIAGQFAPGAAHPAFPRSAQWCCPP